MPRVAFMKSRVGFTAISMLSVTTLPQTCPVMWCVSNNVEKERLRSTIITEDQNCGVDSGSCNGQQEARSHCCHHQHQRLVLCQRRIQRVPRILHTVLRHIKYEFHLFSSRELESGFHNGMTGDHMRNFFNTDCKRQLQLRISFISPLQIDPLPVTFEQNTMF